MTAGWRPPPRKGCVTKVPRFARAKADDASFPQHVAPERHADAAVRLVDRHDKPRLGLIVEVQLSVDADKKRTWPLYAAQYHAALGCTVYVVVITTTRRMARWAREPITTFQPEAVVAVLEGRGLSISDETRETLLACRDAETLDRWLAAAGTVASSAELLQAPSNPDPG